MSKVISAIYEDGILKPLEDIHLPDHQRVNPDPALKRWAFGAPGFTAFIPVINHGAFCGAG